jgi:GDP/UDP-N,N'-diacetylbacillosamine 2-epimerase (hydrolysing)
MKQLKIAIFTVARSDFGIMKNIILRAEKDRRFNLSLIVGSAHSSSIFGNTKKEIDKIKVKTKKFFKFKYNNSSKENILTYFRKTMMETQKLFANYKPACALILGDRYEMMAIALCCINYNIPIAHFCGGSETLGSLDDKYRFAISKMAKIHFLETKLHKKNIIKNQIFKNLYVVGSPALESIKDKQKFKSRESSLKKLKLDINISKKIVTACFQPETTRSIEFNKKNLKLLLIFLKTLNVNIIFTFPNADVGFKDYVRLINQMLKGMSNVNIVKSLGVERYYEALTLSSLLIGNSSSGIVESASFNLPTINLGSRQKNRFAPKNVHHCPFNLKSIQKKYNKLINKKKANFASNPYYKKNCSKKVLDIIYKSCN